MAVSPQPVEELLDTREGHDAGHVLGLEHLARAAC
jgi:predicted Zn-dependent protease